MIRRLIFAVAIASPLAAQPSTPLLDAVHQDQVERARQLIATDDVNQPNRYGVTALSLACENGNADLTRLLLEKGADPNATLTGGETALMIASRTGNVDCVKLLLDRGAAINAKERNGQTAMMWAAAEGHNGVVELLLKVGADFREPLESGFTPLLFAIREGKSEVVRTLLKAGADLTSISSKKGRKTETISPLILAVDNAHFELALQLVDAGADPNDLSTGTTALHSLTAVRKTGLGDDEAGNPAPYGSGNVTSLDFITALVKRGAKVNTQLTQPSAIRSHVNSKGATALLYAAESADLPMIRLLVELGADPLLPNDEGCTPWMAAAGMGTAAPGEEAGTELESLDVLKFLLNHGAEMNTVDKKGETAMHGAAYKSAPLIVKFLNEHGADIAIWNRENDLGSTPLLIARGYRPGNYKPEPATTRAIIDVMKSKGVEIPPDPGPR
jgi:uncharacterized protein